MNLYKGIKTSGIFRIQKRVMLINEQTEHQRRGRIFGTPGTWKNKLRQQWKTNMNTGLGKSQYAMR